MSRARRAGATVTTAVTGVRVVTAVMAVPGVTAAAVVSPGTTRVGAIAAADPPVRARGG